MARDCVMKGDYMLDFQTVVTLEVCFFLPKSGEKG